MTEQAGLPPWVNANTAIWLDYDNDGKLDLFLGGYYPENIDLWHLKTTRMMPESFEYAKTAAANICSAILATGAFEDVTAKLGLNSRRWTLAAVAADLRGTGYPDLFLANDYGVSELFLNEHGERFREAGKEAGVGFAPKSGMNASVGDVFNQGQFAIYVSNISEEGVLMQGNNLWVPRDGKPAGTIRYENLAHAIGRRPGRLELRRAVRRPEQRRLSGSVSLPTATSRSTATAATGTTIPKIAGGNQRDHFRRGELAGDGRARSLPAISRSGSGSTMARATSRTSPRWSASTDIYDGRSVALADFENRGVLDVVVANQRGPLLLYKNTVAPQTALDRVRSGGRREQPQRHRRRGARFLERPAAVAGGLGRKRLLLRRISAACISDWAKPNSIDRVEIRWPSGHNQTLDSPGSISFTK